MLIEFYCTDLCENVMEIKKNKLFKGYFFLNWIIGKFRIKLSQTNMGFFAVIDDNNCGFAHWMVTRNSAHSQLKLYYRLHNFSRKQSRITSLFDFPKIDGRRQFAEVERKGQKNLGPHWSLVRWDMRTRSSRVRSVSPRWIVVSSHCLQHISPLQIKILCKMRGSWKNTNPSSHDVLRHHQS